MSFPSVCSKLYRTQILGISLGPACQPIHSLIFADDLILCGTATVQEATTIRHILYDFYSCSGQLPNLHKSSIHFTHNVPSHIREQITDIFYVPALLPNTMHLGHPIIFNHNDRNKAYEFIYNKFMAKLTTVKANKLNHAGRLIYIQSVLSSISVYYMSDVLFSKTFVEKINAIIRRFWWAGVEEDNPTSPIAYRSWDDICQPKENGGLGIRDLHTMNKSLLIHAAYDIANNKNPFPTVVLRAKYFHNNSFWTAKSNGTRSNFWSSIMQVKKDLCSNVTYQVHAGNSSIWSTPWCPMWNSIHDHLLLPVTTIPLPSLISDLWILGSKT